MSVCLPTFFLTLTAFLLQLTSSALLASLSSYRTLVSTDYVLNLTFTSTSVPASTIPTLRLSTRFSVDVSTLQNCAFATNLDSSYTTGACSTSTNSTAVSIVFTDAYPSTLTSQTRLSLKFTINNPWAATSQSITLALISGATTVASSFTTVSYSASTLASCSWTSTSDVNGVVSSRTVSFTPSVKVITGSYLTISIPFWFGSLLNLAVASPTCSGLTNVDGPLSCTNTSGGSYETFQVSNLFNSNKTVPGAVSLSLSSVYNPWSTYPFGPITYSLVYAPNGTQYVSQSCTGITQTTSTTNLMASFGLSFFSFISMVSNSRNGWFKITNPLPSSGGQLHISWTGGVSISCSAGSSPSLISINSSTIVLGSFSSDFFPNSNISIFTRFSIVAPPSSRTFSITASTFYVSGSNYYPIDTKTNNYSCAPGSFSPASVTLGSYSIGASTTLTISITLGNNVYANSFIGVSFPSNFAVSGTCSTNSSFLACLITNSTYSNISVSATVAKSTVITIIYSVTNPGEAITTSSLSVISYIDYLFDGVIDSTTSGLTLTLGANELSNSSFFAQPVNTTTYSTTSYTLSATLLDSIPAGGYVVFVFPSAITLTSPTLDGASFITTSCSVSTSGNNITLNNCFSSAMNNLNFYVTFGGITNPSSLEPTTSFGIYTYGTNSIINFKATGTTVTMTALALSTSFAPTPSSTVVDATNTYTFTISFFGSPASGDYLLLSLPVGMSISGTSSCSPGTGVASLTCSSPNRTELKVYFGSVPSSSISFTASNIKNYQISGTSVPLKLVLYKGNNYAAEQTSTVSLSFTAATLTAATNHNDQLALNTASNVTITVSAPFVLDTDLNASQTNLTITLPPDITTLSNSSCSVTNLTCSLSGTTFTVSAVGLSVSSLAVTMSNLMLAFSTTSSSFSVQYLYSSSIIASLSTGLTVSIFCSSPCQQCQTSQTSCLSCLPLPNTLTLYYSPNSSCLSSCPDNYFPQNSSCVTCMTSCASCNSSTTCISCATNFYFYNSTCVNPCPNGTYISGSNCLTCHSTCYTCSINSTNCLSCSSSYLFYNNTCLNSCPTGTYNSSGNCVEVTCVANCLTCTSTGVCQVCQSPYYLFLGICYSTCPANAPVPDTSSRTCSVCTSACASCSADGSECYACASGYYKVNGQCYTSCPEGYEVSLTNNSTCIAIQYVSTYYYPTAITTTGLMLFVLLAKLLSPTTSLIGNYAALLSAGAFASGIIMTVSCFSDQTLPGRLLTISPAYTTLFGIGIAITCCSILLGVSYLIYLGCKFDCDAGLRLWRERSNTNKYVLNVIVVVTCMRVGMLRIAYCRLFGRQCFCCYVKGNGYFLKITNLFTVASLLFCSAASIGFSLIFLLNNLGSNQTRIFALDLLILCSLELIILTLDMCLKSREHFKEILQSLPYLRKFRKYQDLQSSDGSLISIQEHQDVRCKTEAEAGPAALPVGGFGAFSQAPSQVSDPSVIAKTLPQITNLHGQIFFDPYEQKKKNDELFFQQRQYTKKFNQLKESYHPEQELSPQGQQYTDNEVIPYPKTLEQIINEKKKDKNNSRTVEEILNQKTNVNPADFLQQISPDDYRPVTEEEIEFLEKIAQKRGVDPALLKELFGTRKHYNQKLLSETLDHHQVPSEAVQHLISPNNNQTTMQHVFGRDSTVDANKLQQILSDPNNQQLVSALFGKDSGLFTLETLKTLLNQFSTTFLTNLLSANQVDRQKLRALMQSCQQHQGQVEGLNSLQKIGGKDLQEHEIVKNILGSQAELDSRLVPKVAAQMSKQSTKNIFSKNTQGTSTMIRKVINNKHIPLQGLNPIQQMPQIVEEFAQLLNCGDQNVEKGLTRMLEEGNYDGETLKQIVGQAGNSKDQMAKLLTYINQNRERQTPIENWPTTPNHSDNNLQNLSEEESVNYLDFDKELEHSHSQPYPSFEPPPKKVQIDNVQVRVEDMYDDQSDYGGQNPFEYKRSNTKTRIRRKQLPEVHLPSEHIYLQRLTGTRDIQKKRNIRTKKKTQKNHAQKFMDEENQIYDLDF